MNYTIRIAHYPFTCPVTGIKIRKGDQYADMDGMALSLKAVLPERRLRKLSHVK